VSLKITGYFFFIMSTNIPTLSFSNQITCHALLRVIIHALQEFAQACKSPIFKGFSFLRLARVAPHCVPGGIRVVSIPSS
jgi:hypothetical protein